MLGLGLALPQLAVRRLGASAALAPLYMIASNRFSLATDWGINATSFLPVTGGQPQGIDGGQTSIFSRYQSARRIWRTPSWTGLGPGRWCFDNSASAAANLYEGKFAITIQRMEIRKLSDLSLVYVVTFGNAGSKVLDPAGRLVSDRGPALIPNTMYTMDLWWTAPDYAAWPAMPPATLIGEKFNSHPTTNLALSALTGGNVFSNFGGMFGPVAYVAEGWDGVTPVGFMFGDSILDMTSVSPFFAPNGNLGHAQQAYGDDADPWSYCSAARYSANFTTTYQDNAGGYGGKNQIDRIADLFAAIPGQGNRPCFNHVLCEHNRNNLSGAATLAMFKGLYTSFAAKIRSRWPGMPIVQMTATPNTTATGFNLDFAEANQTGVGAANTAGGTIQQIRDYIIANGNGEIVRWMGVDSAQDTHGVTFAKWPQPAFSATLVDAVAATVNAYKLSAAPPIGAMLVFEPGVSGKAEFANRLNVVRTVTPNGGAFDVTTTGGSRNSTAEATDTSNGGRTTIAHAAGVTVREASTNDLLHPAHRYSMMMRDRIIARKADIKTFCQPYNAELLALAA